MKLKELLTFKDWFSYRQKVGLLVIAGVIVGLGGLSMYLLRVHTYFIGDDPAACVNCHIMTPYYATWSHSSHGRDVTCSDCHDARTMDLRPARPALYEAWARVGKDVRKASHQEMRSLVCAQCHTEYYFIKPDDPQNPGKANYLMFPQNYGLTCEAAEKWFDEINFYDYIHPLSKTPILKAQHPGYEMALQGIHGQRGVSCADCHMPYKQEGGVKFSDHHIMSPLAHIDRTCQTCHRQDADVLRQNVYERQEKCNEVRNRAEQGHIGEIPVPDYSTKEKAQQAIGLDMKTLREKKQRFIDEIVPKWIDEAKKNGKLISI